jgi:hypothetical protein
MLKNEVTQLPLKRMGTHANNLGKKTLLAVFIKCPLLETQGA